MTDQIDNTTGEVISEPVYTGEFITVTSRFRTPYNHGRIKPRVVFTSPSRTKQEFKDQVDVNKIVAAFTRTGDPDLLERARGAYLDLSDMPASYQDSLNAVIAARDAFYQLPAEKRDIFNNDIDLFLQTASADPERVFGKRNASGEFEPPQATTVAQPPSNPPTAAPAPQPAPSTVVAS